MSLSANYPVTRPTLLLDFARAKKLDPRITFTRSTTAVYYDGATTAQAEQNLTPRSQEFNQSPWGVSRLTVGTNAAVAPDATTTAESITGTAGASGADAPYIGYNGTTVAGIAIGVTVTASMFAKKNTHDFFQLWLWNQGVNSYANFNLATGALGTAGAGVTNHTITDVGNSWYRCTMTFTTTGLGCMIGGGIVASASATRLAAWTLAGTESIYIWGAQLEQRSLDTAYTATTAQTVTTYQPVLLTAPANTARFDHDPTSGTSLGLLIEEARTNNLIWSADISNAIWTKNQLSIDTTAAVAPDGTQTANKITTTTGSLGHFILQDSTTVVSTVYTQTVYAKAGEYSILQITSSTGFDGTGVAYQNYDLSTGTLGTSVAGGGQTATITAVGNGWYRCSYSDTATGTTARFAIAISPTDGSGRLPAFTGNGYSGLFVWGAQMEAGAFATSYIATGATTLTRTADAANMTGVNFSSWYDPDQGTLFYNAKLLGGTPAAWNISDGTTANRITTNVRLGAATGSAGGVITGGVTQFNNSMPVAFGQDFNKGILAYARNDFASALNGQLSTPGTSGTLPAVTQANIGAAAGFASNSVLLKKIAYWPERLTNAQLQTLTKS